MPPVYFRDISGNVLVPGLPMPERPTKRWQHFKSEVYRLVFLGLFLLVAYVFSRIRPDLVFWSWELLKRSWKAIGRLLGGQFSWSVLGIGVVLVFYVLLRWRSPLLKAVWHSLLWFWKGGVARLALGVALLLALTAVVRFWADFVMGALWFYWSPLVWLVGSEAARSLLGVFALFWLYGFGYRYLFLCDKHFITIAPFRVWGSLHSIFAGKDIAGRLSDELTQLQREVETGTGEAPVIAAKSKFAPSPVSPLHVEQAFPEVGVQYEGISPEAVNAFWRRFFDRRLLITGDVIPANGGLLLVARSARHGRWEVRAKTRDAVALHEAVEDLAARAIIDLQEVR